MFFETQNRRSDPLFQELNKRTTPSITHYSTDHSCPLILITQPRLSRRTPLLLVLLLVLLTRAYASCRIAGLAG